MTTGFSSPYPGLRPFDAEEADLFFGRGEQVDELLRRLHLTRFLAVVGPSGCGKSSLVRAGMIAALQSGFLVSAGSRWQFATMRPGGRPMTELATALVKQTGLAGHDPDETTAVGLLGATLRRGPLGLVEALNETPLPEDTNLLVLVDQFEEIFRFRREGGTDEADAFVALLLETARQRDVPIYVVLTMRSDFFGDCAAFGGLPEALNRSQYLTPRLSREQRRAAIVGPARVFGGDVAPELVNRLLNEMGNDPDQLPLMQHLLMRMWTWRATTFASAETGEEPAPAEPAGHRLTLEDYAKVGGLRDALSNHANEAFDRLDARQEAIAETLFRRLSERAPGARDIRRPTLAAEVAELAAATLPELAVVADVFRAPGCSFVVPAWPTPLDENTMLDITHEALIRQWDRLRAWADDEAQSAEQYRFLEHNAALWKQGRMALWGTPNLEMALDWRARERPTARWASRYGRDFPLAMAFLDASASRRAVEEEAQRKQRQRQVRHLRRVAAASVATALLFAGALGGVYWFGYAEHVGYYKTFVRRWGEPVGVDALTAAEVQHRTTSLRFVARGIHYDANSPWRFAYTVNEIAAVDADGRCDPNNDVGTYLSEFGEDFSPAHECRWRFVRDATTGQIVYENAYDKNGAMRWGYEYLPGARDRNHREAYYVGTNGSLAHFKNSPASVVNMIYSDRGDLIQVSYFDRDGNPQPGPDHAYGRRFDYDQSGHAISLTSLDEHGNNLNDTAGNATLRQSYDGAGEATREWALDAAGGSTMFKSGYSQYTHAFDQYGNRLGSAYFDKDGRPALDEDGIHEIRITVDGKGNITGYAFYDRAGKPAISKDGYHKVEVTGEGPYDQWTDWAYFDTEGHPTTNRQGVHEYRETLDQNGATVAKRAFGRDQQPLAAFDGCYEVRYTNTADGSAALTSSCYDKDGKPAADNVGAYSATFRYDERGNDVETRYFDRDGSPVTISKGYHRMTTTYDLFGNMEENDYFDLDGHAVNNGDGYHSIIATYDRRGNQTSLGYQDTDGKLVTGPEGFAKRTKAYDDRDSPIETAYYDVDGNLTESSEEAAGYAVLRQHFDDHWREVEATYFGQDDKPKVTADGFATRRTSYTDDYQDARYFDAEGRPVKYNGCAIARSSTGKSAGGVMETSCLNADGQRIDGTNGVSAVRDTYDDRGELLQKAFVDASDKPVPGPDGAAFVRWRYDNAGSNTEQAYYGTDGKPAPGPDGAADISWRFDQAGHVIERTRYDAKGKLQANAKGYAIQREVYDNHGNPIRITYFGADGGPVVISDGYHEVVARYDERGHITERAFYGSDGKLIAMPIGDAIRRTRYDDHGRIVEDAFFGPDQRPIVIKDGYHRVTSRYDQHGNLVETAYYDAQGNLWLNPDEGFAVERTQYDNHGRMTDETLLDTSGQALASEGSYAENVRHYLADSGGMEEAFYDAGHKLLRPFNKGYALSRPELALYDADGRLIAHCPAQPAETADSLSQCLDPDGHLLKRRVMIARLIPGGQAEQLGIRPGDFLDTYDGQEISQMADARRLADEPGSETRKLIVLRAGQPVLFTVRPGRIGVSMEIRFAPADQSVMAGAAK